MAAVSPCYRLRELRRGRVSPDSMCGEVSLMVDHINHLHPRELPFPIIPYDGGMCIHQQELLNLELELIH